MKYLKILLVFLIVGSGIRSNAQINDTLMKEIRVLNEENDPAVSKKMMENIIEKFQLKEKKDTETIDMLKGAVAMDYLAAGDYKEFDKMIGSINNKFNQTSYLTMAASNLVDENKDLNKAESLAKQALDIYFSIKDDPKAKPVQFSETDWKRFMDFAYYPYNDTYASTLYALGKYKEALTYQEKAFEDSPVNGMPPSVERYTHLLVLNDQPDKAYSLLLEMGKTGKSTEGMNKLLKELYVKKYGDKADYDNFFTELQKNVVIVLKEKLKKKMQHIEAPSFELKDLDGNTVSLSDFKGKTVVIDFWATWCVPCKASFPAMKKVLEKHPEVKFLFINTQEKQEGAVEKIRNYLVKSEFPFYVLMDKPLEDNPQLFQVMSLYKVEGIPTKFVIDANGRQLFSSVGFTTDTELINEMEAMLQLADETK